VGIYLLLLPTRVYIGTHTSLYVYVRPYAHGVFINNVRRVVCRVLKREKKEEIFRLIRNATITTTAGPTIVVFYILYYYRCVSLYLYYIVLLLFFFYDNIIILYVAAYLSSRIESRKAATVYPIHVLYSYVYNIIYYGIIILYYINHLDCRRAFI
jgi:hypothetical protein